MSATAATHGFPGVLYDGDGTLLAGDGPDFTSALVDALPHKALIRDRLGDVEVAVLEKGDRLWLLPASFGTPPELPMPLLTELANVVCGGGMVGLAGRDRAAYEQARDALMLLLENSGGRRERTMVSRDIEVLRLSTRRGSRRRKQTP